MKIPTLQSLISRSILPLFLMAAPLSSLKSAPTDNVYTSGHSDIGVAYEDGNLNLHYHFGDDAVLNGSALGTGLPESAYEYQPTNVTTFVSLETATQVNIPSINSRLGVGSSGGTIYLLPAVQDPDLPFLGFGTEDLTGGDWLSPITFSLVQVTGPGQFSMWSAGTFGSFNFYYSTNNPGATVNGNNTLSIPTGTHAHFNWGFTEPGIYQVTMTASGTHAVDGFVSDTQIITFGVGVVPEPASLGLMLMAGLFALGIYFKRFRHC